MKAVVFDMDGVLVDSEIHWRNVAADFLRTLVPTWSEQDQKSILGMSAVDVHARLVERYGILLSLAEFVGFYRGLASTIYGHRSNLLPGVRDLLLQLHGSGVRMGIASSSPRAWIDLVVERFELRPYFLTLVGSDDVGGKGKPAPDIYQLAARTLERHPDECVAIEDTEKGIRSAKVAGMVCVAYQNGFNVQQDLSLADVVISDFSCFPLELLRV